VLDHGGDGNHHGLPLYGAEAAAATGDVCAKLIGRHLDPLVVFPANKNLVVLEEHVGLAPEHRLLL
jgi:hypothetical protein